MIQKSSRKSTFKVLLVVTLMLGVLTLSGCVATQNPTLTVAGAAGPKENVALTIRIANTEVVKMMPEKLEILAIDGEQDLGPFSLWAGRPVDIARSPLLGIISLPPRHVTPVSGTALPTVDLKASYPNGIVLNSTPQTIIFHLTQPTDRTVDLRPYKVKVRLTYTDEKDKTGQKITVDAEGTINLTNRTILPLAIRWIIEQLYKLVHNYGLAIVLLTLLLKLVTEPLTRMQFKSTIDMQKLQPQIIKLKAKYPNKDDAQKLNAETMKLYKDNNVSLFSGCLPLLVQWPVFLALFSALNGYAAFNNARFLWLPSLATPDALYILPVVVAIATYVQSVTSFIPGQDRSQTAFLTYFMPLLLAMWALTFSAALAIYWALFSLFSAGQQYYVIKRLTKGMAVPEPVAAKPTAKKK